MANRAKASKTDVQPPASSKRHAAVTLSELDTSRFGFVVARSSYLPADELENANDFCRSQGVDLLIARCPTSESSSIARLEGDGFRLMDTVVYWQRSLQSPPLPAQSDSITIRPLGLADAEQAGALARAAFSHYDGHYHADARLTRETSTEVYASWATRCCAEVGVADAVLGTEINHVQAGFVAMKRIHGDIADIALAAVLPNAQGQGIFRALVVRAMYVLREQDYRIVEYSCVLTNIGAQKTLARLGFEIVRSCHTFHKWYS